MSHSLSSPERARPRIAALVGPTASGKTALAVRLRQLGLPVEVVCCDALQLVRDLNAATAKPTAAELVAVPHHLIDTIAPTESVDAGRYGLMADTAIAAIAARGAWPLLVGGTGLYLRAVVRGLATLPASDPNVRARLEAEAASLGLAALHARLETVDPTYAAGTPAANRQRVLRALEVYELSGRPFSAFHAEHAAQPDRYACATIVLEPDRPSHLHAMEMRAHVMAPALLTEVRGLLKGGLSAAAPGMQALGYRQAAAMIQAETSQQEATVQEAMVRGQLADLSEILFKGHRRYAKRQRTWFRKTSAALRVCDPTAEVETIAELLRDWFTEGTAAGQKAPVSP